MSNKIPTEWLRLRALAEDGNQEALKELRRLVRNRWNNRLTRHRKKHRVDKFVLPRRGW